MGETDISENQDEHEIHNITNLETTDPTLDIREMTMPSKDADIISDITQELSSAPLVKQTYQKIGMSMRSPTSQNMK